MERLLGGRLYKAKSMTELALVETDLHLNRNGGLGSRERFDPSVCQCCGAREKPGGQPCVCDGTEWYQLPDGRMECQPHRVVRALHGSKKWWDFRR